MVKLRELGKVKHLSRSGMLVVSVNPKQLPKIGAEVVTRKMEKVGFVYDVIGPTTSPFVLVKPYRLDKIVLDDLFVVVDYGRSGEGKGKGGRKGEGSRKKGDRKRRGY